MVWLNETDCVLDTVVEIYPVKSGKGYVLKGIQYDGFVWKSDKLFTQLLVALASWIDSRKGYQIELYRDSPESQATKFRVSENKGKKVPAIWHFRGDGYSTLEEVTEENPFL